MIADPLPEPLRILLVEDNEHDRIAFSRAVSKEQHPFRIDAYDRAEKSLGFLSEGTSRADVIVVDYDLPGLTGLEMYEELKKEVGEARLPPFLMLTGAGTEDLAVRAIKSGIYDYLVKDPEDRYLKLIPTMIVSVFRRHEQRLAYLEAQQQLARAHRDLEKIVKQRTRELRHTVRSLKDEVRVRMKTERALRESRKHIRKLSLRAIEFQENERKAIARDLHDSIGGNLAAIKMSLEARIQHMGDPPNKDGVTLEAVAGHLKTTIGELRRIAARLRPRDLDSLGLMGAIRGHVRQFAEQYSGLTGSARLEVAEEEVPDPVKVVIFRIVQEALANAAKHAAAENVHVSLTKKEGKMVLLIEDDGHGFDPRAAAGRRPAADGYGMKSMRDRAEINGGSFSVDSRPGYGTRVRVHLPLADAGGVDAPAGPSAA